MLNGESELVRLDAKEIDLIIKYRKCNTDRQDVLHHIANELARQTATDQRRRSNVVLLTGRPLR